MKTYIVTLAAAMTFAMMSPLALAAGSYGDDKSDAMSSEAKMQGHTFEQLDRNADGVISEDELNVYGSTAAGEPGDSHAERQQLMMEDLDMDGNGEVDRNEFEKHQMDNQ